MKKTILLIAAVIAACTANAQLLWKVTAPGSDKTSYIVGTHHIAPPDMMEKIAGLTQAMEKVDKVLGEVDMTGKSQMEIQQASMAHMMAPADSTLSKVFTAAQLDSISKVLDKYTGGMMPIAQMDILKPVALGQTIALLQSQKAFPDFDPAQQLDTKIQAVAAAAGKPTGGLETIEYQMELLFDSPISEQAESLMETVRNDSVAIVDSQRLADAYVAADLDEIYKMLTEGSSALDEDALNRLLLDRNADWAEKLKLILPKESVLVAVGCGHLPGDKGLLELLRKKGFTVTPVK